MPSDLPRNVVRNAAGDAVWSDPTASPFFPDSAAVIFDPDRRRVAAVPNPRLTPGSTTMPAAEAAVPTTSSPLLGTSGATTESSKAPASAAAPVVPPAAAGARSTPQPGPPWSPTDTYAAGQLTAPAVEPARRTVPAGRRNERSAAYQPVTVYRSTPGTLTPPTLEQLRAQQSADGVAPARGLAGRAFAAVRKLAR